MHHVALELPENYLICLFYCATERWHDVFYCRSKWGTSIFFLYSPLNSWSMVQTSMSQQWKDHVLLLSPFNVSCLHRFKESKVNTSRELFYVMKDPDKYMNHKYILNISHLVPQDNIITFSSLLLRGSISWKDALNKAKQEDLFPALIKTSFTFTDYFRYL